MTFDLNKDKYDHPEPLTVSIIENQKYLSPQ